MALEGCQCQLPSWVRGPPGTGLPREGVWVLQGGIGPCSGLFLRVSRSPPGSGRLGFPPSPGWGPHHSFLPLWLSGPKWEGTPEAAAGCGV